MQYDFALAANGGQQIDVRGKFFKYVSGTGRIRVRINRGGYVDLLPGQGVWNVEFETLNISDRTGAANAGTILAGEFDFHDDRVAGEVSVIDGGKARVAANVAFFASIEMVAAGAGAAAQVQVWNKSTNKRIVIESFCVSSSGAGSVGFGTSTAQLATLVGAPVNKHVGYPQSTSAECRLNNAAGGLVAIGNQFGTVFIQANASIVYKLNEPVVIEPGTGFSIWHGLTNVDLRVFCEFFEESL
jgi:hypothetical protein